jgi:two-component system alkaline phosphatase synthesis response regulator PhoP
MSLVYIVEDDINIREIEFYALKNSGFEVKEFECGRDLYQAIEHKIPNLILLDIMLPNEDGLELLTTLRKKSSTSKVPIIMVTAKSTELDKVKGLDRGADDYVTKPFGVMELVSRVKAVLRRTQGASDERIGVDKIMIDLQKHTVSADGKNCELTYKEFELLKMLSLNRGIVLSRDKIMDQVWGFEYEGESRTVDMHIKTLRKKLGESGSIIKTVRNVGYKIEGI